MPEVSGHGTGSGLLSGTTLERLAARVDAAGARANRTGLATLAGVTQSIDAALDPLAVLLAARVEGEAWGSIEQPDSDGSIICGLGSIADLSASGEGRFDEVAAKWREIARGAVADSVDGGPPGSGPIALGGFPFDDRARSAGPWRPFSESAVVVPELSFSRRSGELRMSMQMMVEPGRDPADGLRALLRRLDLLDPEASLAESIASSMEPASIESALPPEHYEAAVARALDAIDERRIEKVVLAREVLVERRVECDPGAVVAALRQQFPSCFVFGFGRGDSAFVGASPELLVRREGLHASTVALAGTAARSADPSVDGHIGERLLRSAKDRSEQRIVTERIARSLRPVSVWVSSSEDPQLVQIANVQHLATPIRARLREPVAAFELAGRLHPTPAVGGEPWPEAATVIAENEGIDRGWYAAPLGWSDVGENGELIVGLRSALIRGTEARCYAGVGVVAGSDPANELAETELKLQALLPILAS